MDKTLTRADKIDALIESTWEMLSEKDLKAMFVAWSKQEYKYLCDEELHTEYENMFGDEDDELCRNGRPWKDCDCC